MRQLQVEDRSMTPPRATAATTSSTTTSHQGRGSQIKELKQIRFRV